MTFLEDETLKLLALHEGYRQFPYRCTADKLTIGYGFNLTTWASPSKKARPSSR
jgi:GH24 family phage-related lysozyme (muramidase)